METLRPLAESIFGRIQFEHAIIIIFGLAVTLTVYFIWFAVLKVAKVRPQTPKQLRNAFKVDKRPNAYLVTKIKNILVLVSEHVYWVIFPRTIQFVGFLVVVLAIAGLFYVHYFGTRPYLISQYPEAGKPWQNMREPLVLVFDKPIKKDKLVLNMAPEIPGKIEFVPSFPSMPDLGLYRKVLFYPEQTIDPEQSIIVYAVGLENLSGNGDVHEANIDFKSGVIPEITSITLPDNSVDVPTKPQILVTLSAVDADFVDWQVALNPPAQVEIKKQTTSSWSLDFPIPLEQTTSYTLSISRQLVTKNLNTDEIITQGESVTVKEINFSTLKAPLTKEVQPQGDQVLIPSVIIIAFDEPMDRASVEERFKIEPQIDGQFIWNDTNDQLTFQPAELLPKDTAFTVEIGVGAVSMKGGVLEQPITHGFRTIGPVRVTNTSPGNGAGDMEINTRISITFNQEVDHESAQRKFAINPSVNGSFSWEGNTLRFTPQENMRYGTQYNVGLEKGIVAVHGTELLEDFKFSFTTTGEQFILSSVPLYYQAERFTCNVAAMRMALAYRGIHLSEGQIKSGLGVGQALNGSTGGDPYKDWIDGHGTYWTAATSFLSGYRNNAVRRNWNITDMLREVRNGNPVIVWWQNGWSAWQWKSWTATPGGYQVSGLNGMHSEVVIGYRGSINNPHTLITRDPWRGTRYYSRSSFDNLWNNSFGRTAIVVY